MCSAIFLKGSRAPIMNYYCLFIRTVQPIKCHSLLSLCTLSWALFPSFEDFVRSQQPNKILNTDEFLSLRSEVLQKLRNKPLGKDAGPPSAAPPGDDEGDIDQPSPAVSSCGEIN